MRTLFIIPLVLMSLVSFPSWGESVDDLVERAGVYYEKFSDVPFTGEVNGRWQGSMKDGKKDGSFKIYHPNGQLMSKQDFRAGKENGSFVAYHSNGQLWMKHQYKNGKREGFSKAFAAQLTVWMEGL